jgi:hypothetical protein
MDAGEGNGCRLVYVYMTQWGSSLLCVHHSPVIVNVTRARILNFLGARESIPRNKFRQSRKPGGPVRQPCSYSLPSPNRIFKNSSTATFGTGNNQWDVLYNVHIAQFTLSALFVHFRMFLSSEMGRQRKT